MINKFTEITGEFIRRWRESRLREDYATALHWITYLEIFPERNFEILNENYLNPKKGSTILHLEHPHGLYVHFRGLKESLEFLINHGTSTEIRKFNPPRRVRKLIGTYTPKKSLDLIPRNYW